MASTPKAAPAAAGPAAPPAVMVIFGAHGDLAKRLLVPALYNLARAGRLDDRFRILGVDHNPDDDAGFAKGLGDFLRDLARDRWSEADEGAIDPKTWDWIAARTHYLRGDFEDPATFKALGARISELAGGQPLGVLFYLAVSPGFFAKVVKQLAAAGLTAQTRQAFRRVVIEKPFGHDLASAKALNRRILKALAEDQIYRIDHFLGKETVRNILAFRFANTVFEPLWNSEAIDSVQITAAETVGVEHRGGYYDQAGALRDMVPNHLFQLLSLFAMERPKDMGAKAIHAAKARVVAAVRRYSPAQALKASVRGQYHAGKIGDRTFEAYRDAPEVDRRSRTETFVAVRLFIDNRRWRGVPFYLRTGKAMSGRDTEVAIRFKPPAKAWFERAFGQSPPANQLVLQIEPHEGVTLTFEAKRPGPEEALAPVRLDFLYADAFRPAPATGYETLVYEALKGDQTLFKRADEIEASWAAVQPFLDAWAKAGRVYGYPAGADGPREAATWIARDGRSWRPVGEP